ncbi:uncharacterized protein LOC117602937 isoform X1 [Osmia lignaria lignaria]|uniref:uncharacterized protein LOC117602937 isoform X1 n=1 Tax=Osmia lignaria lignaria TaxID=1437193 RepID=UPI00402B2CBD
MLLSLFRLTMIVSLLISAVCIESNVRSSEENKAEVESPERRDVFLKKDTIVNHDEDSHMQKRQSSKHNRYSNDQEPKARRSSVHSMERRISRAGDKNLANKMAKDALQSPKMQETMKKLTRVSKPRSNLYASVKLPASGKVGMKKSRSEHQDGHIGRGKKKKRRHHRRFKNGHAEWPKGGSPKRTSNPGSNINSSAKKVTGREKHLIKHNQGMTDNKSRDRPTTSRSNEKVTRVHVDDNDYVDFSSPLITKSSALSSKSAKSEGSVKLHGSERMIDSLMRTTTRNPLKKSPGDQGVEYSDYYSDDDVLRDMAANKIPMQIVRSMYPNDRFARETPYSRSLRRIDRNVQAYHRGHPGRRKGFRYPGNAFKRSHRFQRYPKGKRLGGPNQYSQFLRADRYDQSDPRCPASTEEVLEQPQISEQDAVLDVVQNNIDDRRMNNEIHQLNPRPLNRFDQYETPQDDFRSLETNEGVEPRRNPLRPNSPEIQNLENDQPIDTNFDENTLNQPRISGTTEEDIAAQSQPSFFAGQSYDNLDDTQDQSMKSVSIQGINNIPQSYDNAMDQPLGKILESLGINISTEPSNLNQNENLEDDIANSDSLNQSEEHLLSPSYRKQEFKGENRNEDKEDHTRGHVIQSGGYEDEFLPYTDNPLLPAHNMNISIAVQDTKEIANQILNTIMEELEELKLDHSKNKRRDGLPCRLSGSWSTSQAGIKLEMRVVNRSIIVTVTELATPRFHGSLLNGTWNVSGHAPFKRGAPFTLIATDNSTKSIAVFVGACRVCQGVDTITGVWSIARQPNDCKDVQVATSVFNDVFRKSKLSSLKEHQNSTTTESSTMKHEKRKS